jgi:hypothetical protein
MFFLFSVIDVHWWIFKPKHSCRYIWIGVPPARMSSPGVCAKRAVVDAQSASTNSKHLEHRCHLSGKGAIVSGSGVCAKRIVVDACHHMLGRLSSIIAKELLNDQKIVVVCCGEICLSADLACQ